MARASCVDRSGRGYRRPGSGIAFVAADVLNAAVLGRSVVGCRRRVGTAGRRIDAEPATVLAVYARPLKPTHRRQLARPSPANSVGLLDKNEKSDGVIAVVRLRVA